MPRLQQVTISRKNLFIASTICLAPLVAAGLLYYLSLWALVRLAFIGLIGLVVSGIIISRPKFGVLFCVFYVYSGLSYFFSFHMAYPILGLTFAAALAGFAKGERAGLADPWFIWPLIFFAMFSLQSMLFSYNLDYSLSSFLSFAKVAILSFLIAQFIRSPADLDLYVLAAFAGTVASVSLGAIELKLGITRNISVISGVNLLRFTGTFANPNDLAVFLVSAIPLGIYTAKRFSSPLLKVISILGILVLVLGTAASYSRAATLPIIFILLAASVREARSNKTAMAALIFICVAMIAVFIPTFYWERLFEISEFYGGTAADWSIALRIKAARVALGLIAGHPLVGVGLGNFIARSGTEFYARIVVHNVFLEILVGVGIFGFLSLMAVYWSCVRNCFKVLRSSMGNEHPMLGDLSFYVLISFTATMLAALFFSRRV